MASRSRPSRELKAFEKIALKPGEARRVTLRVPVEQLGFHLEDGTYRVEPGTIQFFVGGTPSPNHGDAEIVKTFRIPPMERRASATTGIVE